jgi:misacylated tRNA(Ala) deacylase
MTDSEPLYLQNSYLKEFDARVIKRGPKFVVLDKTAFYPEGGGQPTDTGTLTYDGTKVNVVKVMKRGSDIYHYLDDDIPNGSLVHGSIDWERRFRHMRLHSGEHLLTGLFESEGSGPKVFSSFSQLDFQPSSIDEETVRRVWQSFNEIVERDVAITVYLMDREELDVGNDVRKQEFLDKISSNIHELRMVEIDDHAKTFCMGTHVKRTGDIGKLKNLRVESKKHMRKIVYFELT